MILECRHCGAPLDVKEGAALTKCRYCGTVSQRQHMRTIATVTPRDFRPPPQWAPPPQFPADSTKPLNYHGGPKVASFVFGFAMVCAVAGAALAAVLTFNGARKGGGGVTTVLGGATGEALARVSLEQTPANLAKQLSGQASEASVYVPLASDRFEYLSISWDAKHPSHPTSFNFGVRRGQRADERIRAALSSRLGGGLDANGHWGWGGLNLSCNQQDGSISGFVALGQSDAPNAHWKRSLQALWKAVIGAAFNLPVAPTTDEKFEHLGAGHPFAQLATFDPATTVDRAAAATQQRFKGALASTFISHDVKVAVDHPLLRDVTMSWNNEKGAQMSRVHMNPTSAFAAGREAFIGCLQGQLGAPKVNEYDYLKKLRDYQFTLPKAWLWVHEASVSMNSRDIHIAAADWGRAINAIARCR